MAYCTLDQLNDRFGPATIVALTDRADVATGVVDMDVLARAMADADAQIDGYLSGRYALPLAATPPLLASLAQIITVWNLHWGEPSAKIKADYDAAIRSLRDIAQGVIRLPDAAGVEPAATGSSGVVVTDRDRPFTADNMTGFI